MNSPRHDFLFFIFRHDTEYETTTIYLEFIQIIKIYEVFQLFKVKNHIAPEFMK